MIINSALESFEKSLQLLKKYAHKFRYFIKFPVTVDVVKS